MLISTSGRGAGLHDAAHFPTSIALSDLEIVPHGNSDMAAWYFLVVLMVEVLGVQRVTRIDGALAAPRFVFKT
jgi:hypothetical protein